jgi:elongator complex protein 4
LDLILGGGLAVGTLFLVEEDVVGSFAYLMLRYFLAEGATSGQSIFVASRDKDPGAILKHLPDPIFQDGNTDTNEKVTRGQTDGTSSTEDQELKIAWRYKDINNGEGGSNRAATKLGHYFDLSKNMSEETLKRVSKRLVDGGVDGGGKERQPRLPKVYDETLRQCHDFMSKEKVFVDSKVEPEERKICRIAIHAAGKN